MLRLGDFFGMLSMASLVLTAVLGQHTLLVGPFKSEVQQVKNLKEVTDEELSFC